MMKPWQGNFSMQERQVAYVVLPDIRMRVLAGKPVIELGQFWIRGSPLFERRSLLKTEQTTLDKTQ